MENRSIVDASCQEVGTSSATIDHAVDWSHKESLPWDSSRVVANGFTPVNMRHAISLR
jgi:hypothetical protein